MQELFSWEEIDQDWLLGARLALPAEQVVHAFNVVAERFGRDWVEASRVHGGTVTRGTSTTLLVVTLGQWLDLLGEALNSRHLLDKVRDGLPDARAELAAIYLVCSGASRLDLEIEPEIVVGNRTRVPDFRVRQQGQGWTYVEVAHAATSMAQAEVRRGLDRIAGLVDNLEGGFALEVFLKREPTPDEIEAIVGEITSRHRDVGVGDTELDSGLGTLYWNAGRLAWQRLMITASRTRPGSAPCGSRFGVTHDVTSRFAGPSQTNAPKPSSTASSDSSRRTRPVLS